MQKRYEKICYKKESCHFYLYDNFNKSIDIYSDKFKFITSIEVNYVLFMCASYSHVFFVSDEDNNIGIIQKDKELVNILCSKKEMKELEQKENEAIENKAQLVSKEGEKMEFEPKALLVWKDDILFCGGSNS